ncbi:MAG: xanthine dehydrogenase family protein molybdopterin-binding subunit [Actinomycetota bacterium]|nr:xanthine dehydrogenase family protein molybdopterin-binding subunit [Actinomycetota bacterium]
MLRREDAALLRGDARFSDDLGAGDGVPVEDLVHMVVVRSTVAHGRVRGIDASEALALPGTVAVVTGADLAGTIGPYPVSSRDGSAVADAPARVVATDTVRYVGEPVAAVLARSRAEAEDAAELVVVDYEPLDPVVTIDDARRAGSLLHEGVPGNVLVTWSRSRGDVEGAFRSAAVVARCRMQIPRLAAAPMEVRACVAAYDAGRDLLTLWASAQDPWRQSAHLAATLRRDEDSIRVVIPEVGGAFGSKGSLAPEYAIAAWCAIHHGRTVRWFEDRSENLIAAYQGRGMEADVELAVGAEGRFLALRASLAADLGAHLYPNTPNVAVTTCMLMTGCYDIEAVDVRLEGFATNKVPIGPYRGAGRPEAAFFVERVVDVAAARSGIDPVELRRRNLVASDAFPYDNGLGYVYDSGDYAGALDEACRLVDYEGVRAEQRAARESGRLVGVGIANYVERAAPGGWEVAEARLVAGGRVVLRVGSSAHGQGHETTFAQIAADALGVSPDDVEVRHGDSAEGPRGVGTFGSRSVTLGGSATLLACTELLARAGVVASSLARCELGDLDYRDGRWFPVGGTGDGVGLADVAAATLDAGEPIVAPARFDIEAPVFSFGTYGAVVEIDPETGRVDLRRVVAVDDAGVVVNPLLAEGQVVGSTVQGVGASLYEEVVHDADGQPLSGSFVSYGIPDAPGSAFELRTALRCTPSPRNPLGAKGIGEAGSIGVPPAVAGAVLDALAPFGVEHLDPPYSPERIWRLVRQDAGSAERP